MKEKLENLRESILAEMETTETGRALYELKMRFQAELKTVMSGMKDLPKEERPTFGKIVNEFKQTMEEAFESRAAIVKKKEMQAKYQKERIDISMPGKNGGDVFITWTGIFLAIASATAYALYIVAVRKTAMSNVPSEKLTFYTVLTGAPMFLIFLKGGMMLTLPTEWYGWLYLLGVAFFPTIIALAFMAISIDKIGATPTAILGVLEPVTGVLIGLLIYKEKLTLFSLLGIVLIFAAVLLVIIGDKTKKISSENP